MGWISDTIGGIINGIGSNKRAKEAQQQEAETGRFNSMLGFLNQDSKDSMSKYLPVGAALLGAYLIFKK